MPQTASRLSLHYTHVSIEGEPSQSAQMFATMMATAYLTSDIEKILDAGEAALDPKSEFNQIMRDVRRWHGEKRVEHPGPPSKYEPGQRADGRNHHELW